MAELKKIKIRNNDQVVTIDIPSGAIISGETPTAAGTADKIVTVGDGTYQPQAGDLFAIKFNNGNSVSNVRLDINGSGLKNLRLGTTNVSTTTFTLGAGATTLIYFDGTFYQITGSYRTSDSNSYDRMYHSVAKQMGETLYRYKLILEGIDGKFYPIVTTNQTSATLVQKTPTNATLKIGGSILYYNTTTTVAADGSVSNTYSEISTANMVYSFNQNGGYQLQRPIYLVGIPQANGGYKLDSNYYTQDLPTTEDGKIYIRLGLVYAENSLRLEIEHPIYEFKDGKIRPYIAEHTHSGYAPISHSNDSTIHVTSAEKAIWNSKEPAFSKNTAFNKNFGTTAGTVCQGNDPRLSDARTPTAHTHTKSQITDFPTIPSMATQAQAEAGTNNTTYMTPLRVKQSMSANPPRYVWKQQILVQPDDTINLVTIMNNIGGTGEYLFEIIGYQGQWWGEIRFYASSPISVSGGGIAKISYIDSDFGGTISVYTFDNTHQSRCFYTSSSYPAFYANYENSDNIVINVYRLGW